MASNGLRRSRRPAWLLIVSLTLLCSTSRTFLVGTRRQLIAGSGLMISGLSAVSPGVAKDPLSGQDRFGRLMMPDGTLAAISGKAYTGSVLFNNRPKVFIAGSTGEIGRRVSLDFLQNGYSVIAGYRDEGKRAEASCDNRTSTRYERVCMPDVLVEQGRTERLTEQLQDAAVVVHVAAANPNFDVLRPTLWQDSTIPEKVDQEGTKALVDAAVAKGVKKFIYVSSLLTNARALGLEESDAFKKMNSFGNLLDKKHEAEEYIKKSGLDYTIIRVAPLTNDLPKDMGGVWFGQADSLRLQDGEVGNRISRDDVSLVVLDAVYSEKASNVVVELVDVKGPPTPRDQYWELHASGKA